jgi:transcriptional regulator with XRE-family HTH domain
LAGQRRENVVRAWLQDERVPAAQIAVFQEKIDTLEESGPEMVPGFITETPVGKDIYKMKIKGNKGMKQLRPMCCRGPFGPAEYTILFCAVEKDKTLVPKDAIERAQANLGELKSDPSSLIHQGERMNALIPNQNQNPYPNPTQSIDSTLRKNLTAEFQDKDYRYAYAESFLSTKIASQIKTIRQQREMTQAQVAELMDIKQPGYARFEDVNHSVWKTDTLWDIARALDVRVNVSFESFGSLIDEKEHFDKEHLERPSFADDPAFHDKPQKNYATDSDLAAIHRYAEETERMAKAAGIEIGAWNSVSGAMEYLRQTAFCQQMPGGADMVFVSKMSVGGELHSGELRATVQDQLHFGNYANVVYIDEARMNASQRQLKVG